MTGWLWLLVSGAFVLFWVVLGTLAVRASSVEARAHARARSRNVATKEAKRRLREDESD